MVNKISTIRNPLTIIAIFAGIAEVSGTIVLPFISVINQQIFMFFLIGFPILLVILFFLTLNFNNSVLYAPSDFQNEENYMEVLKFNNSESRLEKVMLSSRQQIETMSDEINILKGELSAFKIIRRSGKISPSQVAEQRIFEKETFLCRVSPINNSNEFIGKLIEMGYRAEIYHGPSGRERYYQNNKNQAAIWLGKNLNSKIVKDVISVAIDFYPHLKYIMISGDLGPQPPDEVHDELYVGGSTQTAIRDGLIEFSKEDFRRLLSYDSIDEMHKFIRSKYSKNS